jgi:hypothetical protein
MANKEFEQFDNAVRTIISVSHEELKRREEEWQRNNPKKKPGPKPKQKKRAENK